ncbi:MAG TPA: thioredoxin family protein [Chloroflexaceae bacterium]|mgnify:CR=1 FL=1|nr:thioredoxin family protein [Chloroflexaceae bacterium]
MAERLLILAALAAALAGAWAVLRWRHARRLRALAERRPFAGLVPTGRPAVVAFTLPGCAECRARQAPALERLRVRLGPGAHIATLRADAHPALVAQLGLMTVPATAVLDAGGAVRALNQGYADEARLVQQLADLGPAPGALEAAPG